MRHILKRIWKDSSGATAVEYGMILAMIFLAMVAAVQTTGNSISNVWNKVSSDSQTAMSQAGV